MPTEIQLKPSKESTSSVLALPKNISQKTHPGFTNERGGKKKKNSQASLSEILIQEIWIRG